LQKCIPFACAAQAEELGQDAVTAQAVPVYSALGHGLRWLVRHKSTKWSWKQARPLLHWPHRLRYPQKPRLRMPEGPEEPGFKSRWPSFDCQWSSTHACQWNQSSTATPHC